MSLAQGCFLWRGFANIPKEWSRVNSHWEYADDTTLFSGKPNCPGSSQHIWPWGQSAGPRQNSRQVSLEPISFLFNNALIHFLPTFKFLGYTLSKAVDMKPEVDQHRNLAAAQEPQPVPVEALNATMKCLQKHYSLGLQCLYLMSFMLQNT